MGSCFVSLIVNLSAESVSELLGAAAALLTQIMAPSEVLTEILVVTVGRHDIIQYSRQNTLLIVLADRK